MSASGFAAGLCRCGGMRGAASLCPVATQAVKRFYRFRSAAISALCAIGLGVGGFCGTALSSQAAPASTPTDLITNDVKAAFARATSNAGADTTDPAVITALSFAAYVWGTAPEFVYRWIQYHERILAPVNTLVYGANAAAWNNAGNVNAGNSSVLYVNGLLDLTHQDLVLTIPPTNPPNYIVAQLFDVFINTFSAPGTRRTRSVQETSYLLVGPNSRYSHETNVQIKGVSFPVISSDTNLGNVTVRVRADSLVPASDRTSTASVYANVIQKFALNTLEKFLDNGGPVYPASYTTVPPTRQQYSLAENSLEILRTAVW